MLLSSKTVVENMSNRSIDGFSVLPILFYIFLLAWNTKTVVIKAAVINCKKKRFWCFTRFSIIKIFHWRMTNFFFPIYLISTPYIKMFHTNCSKPNMNYLLLLCLHNYNIKSIDHKNGYKVHFSYSFLRWLNIFYISK